MRRIARNLVASVACVMALTAATAMTAGASETLQTPTTGQPGSSAGVVCQSFPETPGQAANNSGSVFSPTGQAGIVYAGNTPQTSAAIHANSTAAASQYDVACSHQK